MHSLLGMVALAVLAAAVNGPLSAAPPPHGEPVITSVWISTRDIRAGQTVSGRVETSNNIGYVEARLTEVEWRSVVLHQDGPGKFSLSYRVPWWLPPWWRHGYTLELIAHSIDGVAAKEDLPIHVH